MAKKKSTKPSDAEAASKSEPSEKRRKELPLISVPGDEDIVAEEMAELFDEDSVSHQHGGTEPEGH